MQVQEIMTTKVVSVTPDTSVMKVAELLDKHNFIGIPVISTENQVQGVVTEHDLFTADHRIHIPTYIRLLHESRFLKGSKEVLPYVASQISRTTAADVMNSTVYFVRPEMEVERVAALMQDTLQDPVCITDKENHLLGIISKTDVARFAAHGAQPPGMAKQTKERPIDRELYYVHQDLHSRFAYIARTRANVWLTTATILFIVGFIMGVIYVISPAALKQKASTINVPGKASIDSILH